MDESPLAEANPLSLNDLFEKDPLSLSDVEIEMIVEAYRSQRAAWAREEKEAKSQGRRPKTSMTAKAVEGLNLNDLDIKI